MIMHANFLKSFIILLHTAAIRYSDPRTDVTCRGKNVMNGALAKLTLLCFAAVAGMMLPSGALAQSELVGTCKLDVEKSKFTSGPGPKASVLTYAAVGEALKVSTEEINARGYPTKYNIGTLANY